MDLNNIGTIITGLSGLFQQNQGFDMQIQAANMNALGFQQQAASTVAIAEYNIELDNQALARSLDQTASDVQKLMGKQRTQMATKGVTLGSKSFLAITMLA